MNNIIALLKAEQKRAVEHLAKYEPGSEEYARCLTAAREMDWWVNSTETVVEPFDPFEPPARPAPVEEKPAALSGIADRPFCKGRAYDPNRYSNTEE